MRIIVNHLTRMYKGHICVAGLDMTSGGHVRPVVKHEPLKIDLLARHGGPFEMGALIDLGDTHAAPDKPHVEDHLVDLARVKSYGVISDEVFWKLLDDIAQPSLRAIFGPEIKHLGKSKYGTDAGEGLASLGCLRPAYRPRLHMVDNVLRVRINDGEIKAEVAVTDIRLFQEDHVTPDLAKVDAVNQRLLKTKGVILSLGLSREYPRLPTKDQDPKHWLQMNNIHFQETPVWRLGS